MYAVSVNLKNSFSKVWVEVGFFQASCFKDIGQG